MLLVYAPIENMLLLCTLNNFPSPFRTQQTAITTCEPPPMMRVVPRPAPCTTLTIGPLLHQAVPQLLVVAQVQELQQVLEHRAAWLLAHGPAAMTLDLLPDSAMPSSTPSADQVSLSSLRPAPGLRQATFQLNAVS